MQDAILAQLPDIAREATAQRKAERKTSSTGRAG
jgi:hypothetical protein